MNGTSEEGGRARVQRVLIEPLVELGMVRPNRMTVAQFVDFGARLQNKLAYMSEANLCGLRAALIRLASGKTRDQWPKEVTILSYAHGIQQPPPRDNDYAVSVLRSAMGQRAYAEGYHVELLNTARRYGPPPSKYVLSKLQEEARENQDKERVILDRFRRDVARADERKWLAGYQALRAECLTILGDLVEGTAA